MIQPEPSPVDLEPPVRFLPVRLYAGSCSNEPQRLRHATQEPPHRLRMRSGEHKRLHRGFCLPHHEVRRPRGSPETPWVAEKREARGR